MFQRIELILTPWIALDTIVRIILFLRRGSHCSARGGVATEGTSRDKKNVEISITFGDPYRKCLRKAWKFFCFFFFFSGPSIETLLRFRDFERPEHAPRSPAGTRTCAGVYRRPPCVPRRRERQKVPTGAGEKRATVQKKCIWFLLVLIVICTVVQRAMVPPFYAREYELVCTSVYKQHDTSTQ